MLWYEKIYLINKPFVHSDEATQQKRNTNLSTNEIIEDTQSTREEFNNGISRNALGRSVRLRGVLKD
jgi:hypothetical protein